MIYLKPSHLVFIGSVFLGTMLNCPVSYADEIQDGTVTINGRDFFIFTGVDPKIAIKEFNSGAKFNHIDGQIINCANLVDIPVGVVDGNHSYGGTCKWQQNGTIKNVEICADEMVGHFSYKETNLKTVPKTDLAKYVGENCWGG
jgi:hypothetical protein